MKQQNDVRLERQRHADEIIARLKSCVADVLSKYPVEIAYLHGSVARGCPLPSSDVDIALVLVELPPSYERLMLELNIQAALEDACHLSNVDVRTINNAPLMVQGNIVQEGVLLYSRNKDRRVAFEVLTRKKYFDYRPMAERMQEAFLDHIRREGLHGQPKDRYFHSKQSTKLPG
jgi:predicted nucleotidyltransferase